MEEKKFGLFTTVSMISGIVIGSGIFFKTDDILIAAGGSVVLGSLLWILSAFGIIFGGLTISLYAKREAKAGGLITYSEMAWGDKWGYIAGWFQTAFYFPAISAILSFVASVYLGLLFGINDIKDPRIWIMTLSILVVLFVFNVINTRNAGKFQNFSLVLKVASLIVLALFGFIFGEPSNLASLNQVKTSGTLFAGLIACAFSFDGWFVAPSIAHEIKEPKRNLSRALILAPILILIVYLAYFIGINYLLGPKLIIELGDASVGYVLERVVGSFGMNLTYALVFMSILGTINGLILGYIRLPYSLALRKEFFKHEKVSQVHHKYEVSIYSSLIAFSFTMMWLILHALSVFEIEFSVFKFSALEIDSLPIVLMYIFYISLFVKVIIEQLKDKSYNNLYGYLYPSLAIFGSLLIVFGGFSDPNAVIYLLISLLGIGLGLLIRPKEKQSV